MSVSVVQSCAVSAMLEILFCMSVCVCSCVCAIVCVSVDLTEPYPQLESVVATLSTGAVAPSDRIGFSDKKLIMR